MKFLFLKKISGVYKVNFDNLTCFLLKIAGFVLTASDFANLSSNDLNKLLKNIAFSNKSEAIDKYYKLIDAVTSEIHALY